MYSDREKNRKMHPGASTKALRWNKSIAKNVIYILFYVSLWCFFSDWIIRFRFSPLYFHGKSYVFLQLLRKNCVHSVICIVTSRNSCGIWMFFFHSSCEQKMCLKNICRPIKCGKILVEFHFTLAIRFGVHKNRRNRNECSR